MGTQSHRLETPATPAGRYLPLATIGRGGMGRIDLALALGIPGAEQLVVLKRLRDPADQTEEDKASLVLEARLSARLMHANVCATLGLEMLDGEIVLVLEYLQGASLAALARAAAAAGEPLPRPILLRIVREMLAGLAYAHDLADYDGTPLSIVHRDVSPSNVLVTSDGVAKVLDFGIATAARSATDTPSGFIKGKLGYMAPEQILGRSVDRRADIYAVGVVLWEGLTHRRFSASDSIQICLERRLQREPPRMREIDAAIPRELEDVVRRCLMLAPDARWPTACALRGALDDYVRLRDEDASADDVARFVLRQSGVELEARRTALRRHFPRAIGTAPMAAAAPCVADDSPTLPAMVLPRRGAGKVLPVLAGLTGLMASWTFDALPSARAGAGPARAQRTSVVLAARRAPADARARARGPASAARADARAGPKRVTVVPRPDMEEEEEPESPPADGVRAAPPAETGFVTIDAYPWARVFIDGADRGVTPMVRLPIAAGPHVLVLESTERGRHVSALDVRAGETVAARWRWE